MKKRVVLIFSLLLSLLLSGGCAQKNTEKVVIRLWNAPGVDASEAAIARHEKEIKALEKKYPNVVFISEKYPTNTTDYRTAYDKALMLGKAPAFVKCFSYTDIPTRIENNTIADITELINSWDIKKQNKILDTFDDALCVDGKWYGIPYIAYSKGMLYNKKLISDSGAFFGAMPRTWNELAQMCSEVERGSDATGFSFIGMDWCAWPFTTWVWSAGGEMIRQNSDGSYGLAFAETPGVDAAEFLHGLIWNYKVTQSDILEDYALLKHDIQEGRSAAIWGNFSDLVNTSLENGEYALSDFSNTKIPTRDKTVEMPSMLGCEVVTFNPNLSRQQLEIAFEIAEDTYFSDAVMDWQMEVIKNSKCCTDVAIPGRIDYYEKKLQLNNSLSDVQRSELLDLAKNARPEPYCPHWIDLKSRLAKTLQEIFLDESITREQTRQKLQACADELYELYPVTFKNPGSANR